jgi:hypothetical protein
VNKVVSTVIELYASCPVPNVADTRLSKESSAHVCCRVSRSRPYRDRWWQAGSMQLGYGRCVSVFIRGDVVAENDSHSDRTEQ